MIQSLLVIVIKHLEVSLLYTASVIASLFTTYEGGVSIESSGTILLKDHRIVGTTEPFQYLDLHPCHCIQ